MCDYEVYFDDSGTHSESEIVVAACYVASKSQWTDFVRNWDEVRKVVGFEAFHMADFMLNPEKRVEPYCNWTDRKKKDVYRRLSTIIRNRAQHGFGIAITKKDYDDAAPDEIKRHYAKDHYAYAVKCLIGLIRDWRERWGVTRPMQYVFDRMPKGKGGKGEIMAVWDSIRDDEESARAHGLIKDGYQFEDKAVYKPLQAADILAWNVYSHHLNVVIPGRDDLKYVDWKYRLLRENRPMSLGFISREQMQHFFTRITDHYKETGEFPSAVVQARIDREERRKINEAQRLAGKKPAKDGTT